jgi:hypothetical protein
MMDLMNGAEEWSSWEGTFKAVNDGDCPSAP